MLYIRLFIPCNKYLIQVQQVKRIEQIGRLQCLFMSLEGTQVLHLQASPEVLQQKKKAQSWSHIECSYIYWPT